MNAQEVARLLTRFEKRLATLADQARETRERAQHALDRLNRLRQDVKRLKAQMLAEIPTDDDIRIPPDKGSVPMPPEAG